MYCRTTLAVLTVTVLTVTVLTVTVLTVTVLTVTVAQYDNYTRRSIRWWYYTIMDVRWYDTCALRSIVSGGNM